MTLGDGDRPRKEGTPGAGERKGSFKGTMEKAKEAIGLGKKEKKAQQEESAVAD